VDMYPAPGSVLTVGTYPNATRYPFNGSGNGLNVDGEGRGCNTLTGSFTVKQAVFSASDNSLKNFDATFTQHCEGATPALNGELKYNSAPVTSAPTGVSGLNAVSTSSGLSITWQNPAITRYSYTVVRIERSGSPYGTAAIAGVEVYAGTGTSAVARGLTKGKTYTVAVYTVDIYGNVSNAVKRVVTY
ncbi:MAG: hypothetical protein ACM3ML_05845, partial [Micromonosporaceae bacterium]